MNHRERNELLAEKGALLRLLADIPEEDVLDRMSFQSRLDDVEARLDAEPAKREPARARLTFRGKPVVGSHGILADFAATASKAFTDAVSMMAAAQTGPLAPVGPIPDRGANQLLITSTAIGSFGFEFEEVPSNSLLWDESPVVQALEQTQNVLLASTQSDDDLADVVAGTDLRAIAAVKFFLDTLVGNEAVCALEFENKTFRFDDMIQIQRSLDRLSAENLHEDLQTITGEFTGILPNRRTFEFKRAENSIEKSGVFTGKISREIADPDLLNKHLHKNTHAQFTITRVGSGRPRYILNSLPPDLQ
jgi:hypothetical protein